MAANPCVQCRVTPLTKTRLRAIAQEHQLTESALLKGLVETALLHDLHGMVPEGGNEQPAALQVHVEMVDPALDVGQRDGLHKLQRRRTRLAGGGGGTHGRQQAEHRDQLSDRAAPAAAGLARTAPLQNVAFRLMKYARPMMS